MDSCIMKIICSNNGSLEIGDLVDIGSGLMDLKGVFDLVYGNSREFAVVEFNRTQRVVGKTSVRLCKAGTCTSCNNLHLCKFYLYGDCRASRGRRGYRYCHDMDSEHNAKVLRDNNLQMLDSTELCKLLLQNDNTLLPPVCFSYNEGSGEYGLCPEQMSCRRLHICDKYIRGTCSSGGNCSRSHDFFEPHPLKTLEERGIPVHLINSMHSVYQNIRALKMNTNSSSARGRHNTPKAASEKTEICLYFVKGRCKQGDKCWRVHFNMPYRWEVQDKNGWSALPNNEDIEKDYCNPAKTKSEGSNPVCFDTMTRGLSKVRRLSTLSSVLQPNFLLTTEWAWYWEDEYGSWVRFASIINDPSCHAISVEKHVSLDQTSEHRLSSITNEDLERKYHEDSSTEVAFMAGNQTYQLSLQDMVQRNERYGTRRKVRRRPVFVSSADAQQIKSRKPPNLNNYKALPGHWDKSMVPENGYKRVTLQNCSEEYQKIQDLFQKTMQGVNICSIERVQNRPLWEVFQLRRDQMRKSNTGKYSVEKLLFHGTDSQYINVICQQNFDWRICGTHGTVYGKGSYFARDAKYSHSYTGSSGLRTMFVCRVLVGSYTTGHSSYVRPPSKDGGDTILYDSCVDNVKDPSIFVVFEKHQVYPEYLIRYKENTLPSSIQAPSSLKPHATITVLSSSAIAPATSSSVATNRMTASALGTGSSSLSSNPFIASALATKSHSLASNPVTVSGRATASPSAGSNPVPKSVLATASPSAATNPVTASGVATAYPSAASNPVTAPFLATASPSAATNPVTAPFLATASPSAATNPVTASGVATAYPSAASNPVTTSALNTASYSVASNRVTAPALVATTSSVSSLSFSHSRSDLRATLTHSPTQVTPASTLNRSAGTMTQVSSRPVRIGNTSTLTDFDPLSRLNYSSSHFDLVYTSTRSSSHRSALASTPNPRSSHVTVAQDNLSQYYSHSGSSGSSSSTHSPHTRSAANKDKCIII